MNLHTAIERYLSLKRSLGAIFDAEARILRFFSRVAGNVPVETISAETCHVFCRGTGPPTRWWERKHYTLRNFFSFLVSRGHLAASPVSQAKPNIPHHFEPYIYSHEELQRLFNATSILEDPRLPLQHRTFRVLLLTLYAAGLRPSEGLRLRCGDVKLNEGILAIWDTKFFKSRFVPIGTDLVKTLKAYSMLREQLPMPSGPQSVFFASQTGHAISLGRLEKVFAQLRTHASIQRPSSVRWQPRLHDLRHTFATHRLVAWYREGQDLQIYLPLLATYLGHVNLSGTKTYLSMTPELLTEASKRFERYAAPGKEETHHAN